MRKGMRVASGLTLCSLVLAACQTANNTPIANVSPVPKAPTATLSSTPTEEPTPFPEDSALLTHSIGYNYVDETLKSCIVGFDVYSIDQAKANADILETLNKHENRIYSAEAIDIFSKIKETYIGKLENLQNIYTKRIASGENESDLKKQYYAEAYQLFEKHMVDALQSIYNTEELRPSKEYLNQFIEETKKYSNWSWPLDSLIFTPISGINEWLTWEFSPDRLSNLDRGILMEKWNESTRGSVRYNVPDPEWCKDLELFNYYLPSDLPPGSSLVP